MTRQSACSLQHSLVSHLILVLSARPQWLVSKKITGGCRASPHLTSCEQDTTVLCLADRSTWPRKRRLHAANPRPTMPTRSFCANDFANRCKKRGHDGLPLEGIRWGCQDGTRSCLEAVLWTLRMLGTTHGSCFDFLLAEHLTERGLFIYLA
jgi:hypothetical protein